MYLTHGCWANLSSQKVKRTSYYCRRSLTVYNCSCILSTFGGGGPSTHQIKLIWGRWAINSSNLAILVEVGHQLPCSLTFPLPHYLTPKVKLLLHSSLRAGNKLQILLRGLSCFSVRKLKTSPWFPNH